MANCSCGRSFWMSMLAWRMDPNWSSGKPSQSLAMLPTPPLMASKPSCSVLEPCFMLDVNMDFKPPFSLACFPFAIAAGENFSNTSLAELKTLANSGKTWLDLKTNSLSSGGKLSEKRLMDWLTEETLNLSSPNSEPLSSSRPSTSLIHREASRSPKRDSMPCDGKRTQTTGKKNGRSFLFFSLTACSSLSGCGTAVESLGDQRGRIHKCWSYMKSSWARTCHFWKSHLEIFHWLFKVCWSRNPPKRNVCIN